MGPTASGKTVVADRVSASLGGEVVTADSMQVYKGMDIGTAKPAPNERSVPHHCIDLVDPGTPFSAALYQQTSRKVIEDLFTREKQPVLAGGTGLYVRAAVDEMEFPRGNRVSETRMTLEEEAEKRGAHAMHEKLRKLDPASAELIHPNNVRRTIRALEMAAEGRSYAEQAAGFSERRPHYPTLFFGLEMPRDLLYKKIDARVDAMIASGLLDEVRRLLSEGFRDALTATQAIGYKELVPVVEDDADLSEATDAIKQATRRYAKRQTTWFKADPRVRWIDVAGLSPDEVASLILDLIASDRPSVSD